MAPRKKPRKVGLTRMDAALDAVSPFGFRRDLIRKTVKELLKVYGGDDGWVFIEDGSYAILIDALLQNGNSEENKLAEEGERSQIEARDDNNAAPSTSGPSNEASGPKDTVSESMDIDLPMYQSGHDSFHTEVERAERGGSCLDIDPGSEQSCLPLKGDSVSRQMVDTVLSNNASCSGAISAGTDQFMGNSNSEIGGDTLPRTKVTDCVGIALDVHRRKGKERLAPGIGSSPGKASAFARSNDISNGEICIGSKLLGRNHCGDRVHSSPNLANNVPVQRRRPCHGWLGGDEEEELVDLSPAMSQEHCKVLINGTGKQKERVRKWDMKPGNS